MEVDVLYFQCCEVTKPSLTTLLHRSRWHCWLIEMLFRGWFKCSTLNIFEGNDKFQVRSVIADPPPLSPDHGGTIALTKLWQNRQNSGSWGDLAEGGRVYSSSCTKHLVIITYIYSGKCYIISYHYISSGRYRSMPMKRLVDLNHGALFEDTSGLVGSAPFKLGDQVRLSVTWMLMDAKWPKFRWGRVPRTLRWTGRRFTITLGKVFSFQSSISWLISCFKRKVHTMANIMIFSIVLIFSKRLQYDKYQGKQGKCTK